MRTVNVGMYSEIGTNEAHFKNESVQSDLKVNKSYSFSPEMYL